MVETDPFLLLKSLSDLYAGKAKQLPAEKEISETQTVVCFSLMGENLAIALEELAELLEVQNCTRLPRVKRWVKGVANVRGRLLPVMDLADFLGGRLQTAPKLQRVIVVEFGNVYVGLTVDRVYGMRRMKVEDYRKNFSDVPKEMAPYVEGGFKDGDEHWLLMRPARLLQDKQFLQVAA